MLKPSTKVYNGAFRPSTLGLGDNIEHSQRFYCKYKLITLVLKSATLVFVALFI